MTAPRTEDSAAERGPQDAMPYRLLALFVGLHVINQIDRNLVASFGTEIMADLALTRSQFALIAGVAFSLVYAVTAVGAGLLADRIGRVRVLAGGVGIWSLSTAASGLATGFWSLLALRPFVAAGEATLVPTATNIILARTPDDRRATASGIFFLGIPLGVGCSYLLAATLGRSIGWRTCFLLMGVIGLVATLMVLAIRDTAPRVHAASGSQLAAWWATMRRNSRLRLACLAVVLFHAHTATGAFTQLWLVTERGLTEASAAALYGTVFIIVGSIASVGSGAVTDWLHRRGHDRARSLGWIMLAMAPLILLYRLGPPGPAALIAGMVASVIVVTATYGPCFAIIEKELPAELKGTATGINMLVINVVMLGGLVFAIGAASQALADSGVARSWTWPLLAADMLAFLAPLALLRCGAETRQR